MTLSCKKCGGMMEYRKDAYGPYWACFLGCSQIDLLQPPSAELDLLVKVHSHGSNDPRDARGRYEANNVAGIRRTAGRDRPRAGEYYNQSKAFNRE